MTEVAGLGRRAVLLDRDGILNRLVPTGEPGVRESPLRPQDVVLMPDAVESVLRLRRAGYLIGCVSNQPAAAKGQVSLDQIKEVHSTVLALLGASGAILDASEICVHHPMGTRPELTRSCTCRKPEPGLLIAVAAALRVDPGDCWMIGDSDSDVIAGQRAGMRTILVETAGSGHKRVGPVGPDLTVSTLSQAVGHLLGVGGPTRARSKMGEC